jgi:hypothetical protein
VQNALESKFSQEGKKGRLKVIVDETWGCIKEKQIDFSRLDMIFPKLLKKNFNIVVREKLLKTSTLTSLLIMKKNMALNF